MFSRENNTYRLVQALGVIPFALLIFFAFLFSSKCEYGCSVVTDSDDYEICFLSSQAIPNLASFQKTNTFAASAQFAGDHNFGSGSLIPNLNEAQNHFLRIFNLLRAKKLSAVVHQVNRYYIFALNRMRN